MANIQNKKTKYIFGAGLLVCCALLLVVFTATTKAAWEEPQSDAPEANIFTPLHVGPDNQAKKGSILLDPLYTPTDSIPSINYPLEVRGSNDVFINNLEVTAGGSVAVDTDTLYVDGDNHYVGVGTTSPSALLEVANAGVAIGSNDEPVTSYGLAISNATQYGLYAYTQADDQPSVYGYSPDNPGVYGFNTSDGTGIYAESESASALVGSVDSPLRDSGTIKAGVYAYAHGLGAWAGYFEQRVYGSQETVASSFVASRLPDSQVPQTAGWEPQKIEGAVRPVLDQAVFDGEYIWIEDETVGWDLEPYFLLIDPETGSLVDEFRVLSSGGIDAHYPSEMIYEDGYIWVANGYTDSRGISRIDPATHQATVFEVGTRPGGFDGTIDLVYDTTTNPGTPYVWVLGYDDGADVYSNDDNSYYITRLRPDTGDYGFCTDAGYDDPATCAGVGTWTEYLTFNGFCTDSQYTDQASCTANFFSWIDTGTTCQTDDGGGNEIVNIPTGLTSGGGELWVSFAGSGTNFAAGIGSFDPSDPMGTLAVGCITDAVNDYHSLYDITYGDGYIWAGGGDDPVTEQSIIYRFDPADIPGSVTEYKGGTYMNSSSVVDQIEFDTTSSGEPFVWAKNFYKMVKFSINASDDLVVAHRYDESPLNLRDFIFDYRDTNDPFIWATYSGSGAIMRHRINAPYDGTIYLPKGANSSGMVFDGTYVWTANDGSNTVSKFRIEDGTKVGDYIAGWFPLQMIFDGQYIWTINDDNDGQNQWDLTQVRASDGIKVGEYNTVEFNFRNYTRLDMAYDGQYIWITDADAGTIRIIDTDVLGPDDNHCDFSGAGCSGVDTCNLGAAVGPSQLAYDGQSMWVTHKDNKISQVSYDGSDCSIDKTITLDAVASDDYNIQEIYYDGTYLWLGTARMDDYGNSIYRINPDYADNNVVGKYQVYNDPGTCQGGDRQDLFCHSNEDCPGSTCDAVFSNVEAIIFDGVNLWIKHGGRNASPGSSVCNDGVDNDGDGLCDEFGCGAMAADPSCSSLHDMHETSLCNDGIDNDNDGYIDLADSECSDANDNTEGEALFGDGLGLVECRDGLDNDGNGMCDFDGAAGMPGCSGRPDPNCSSPTDLNEFQQSYFHNSYISRIQVATGQLVESYRYDYYSQGQNYNKSRGSLVFDGRNVWLGDGTNNNDYIIRKFYAGTELVNGNAMDSVMLQNKWPGQAQPGSFSISGLASFGQQLWVEGDLVVLGNQWGGSSDQLRNFGVGCDNGEFVKGVDTNNYRLQCRPL